MGVRATCHRLPLAWSAETDDAAGIGPGNLHEMEGNNDRYAEGGVMRYSSGITIVRMSRAEARSFIP